jgi:hypothetical protein
MAMGDVCGENGRLGARSRQRVSSLFLGSFAMQQPRLVVLALLGLALAGCSNKPAPVNIAAVNAMEKLGGMVDWENNKPGNPVVGVRFFFGSSKVTDADLKGLKEFKSLQHLELSGNQVTDAGLRELKELKSLQQLDLNHTQVTDAGLKELKELQNVQTLILRSPQITDAGLKELKELKSLQRLYLLCAQVTDVGLKELKELKSLRELHLTTPKVTEAGVKELQAALPELKIVR